MRKPVVLLQVLMFLLASVFAQAARAATLHVKPAGVGDGLTPAAPANLQAALDAARVNGETDTLLLAAGVYDASAAGADTFDFDAGLVGSDGLPVALQGGWDQVFAYRGLDPAATVLDGGSNARIFLAMAVGASAVANLSFDALTFRNGKTTPATVPAHGAAILSVQANGGSATIAATGCVFASNLAESSVGGAIAAQGPVTVTDSEFVANQAYSGGAVYLWPTATPAAFASCGFADNSIRNPANPGGLYGWQGSTIFSHSPDLTVSECEFSGMSDGSTSGAGSAIYVHTGGHLTVKNSAFRNVSILYWGSAIQLWDAGASVSGCLFANNRAGGPPGGSGYAAVTYLNNSGAAETTSIVNSTFVGNRSDSDHAGDVHFRGGILTIRNSIFFDNTSNGITCEQGCVGSIDFSSVEGGSASANGLTYGANNSSADPLFAVGHSDYPLQAASPCVDAGDNAAVPAGFTEDFDGTPRIFAVKNRDVPAVDLGWDEYYDGTLEFTAPAPGTFWLNDGTARAIAWSCQNIGGDVRLLLWQGERDTGHEVLEMAANVPCADQAFTWTPPGDLPDALDYAVAMESLRYPTLGHGTGPLAIQHLHLTAPNRGAWTQGSSYAITWESSGLAGATVLIELYDGARRVRTIAAAAPNTGSYTWKVPLSQAPGNTFRVRVSTTSPAAAEDFSDANVRILPAITLAAPNGGQVWKRGTTQAIRWTYKNKPGTAVRLELYRNGVFSSVIAASAPIGAAGAGSYLWKIPATQAPAATYTVKVRSATLPKVYDLSNKMFSITK